MINLLGLTSGPNLHVNHGRTGRSRDASGRSALHTPCADGLPRTRGPSAGGTSWPTLLAGRTTLPTQAHEPLCTQHGVEPELYIVATVLGSVTLGVAMGYAAAWITHRGKLNAYIKGRDHEHVRRFEIDRSRGGPGGPCWIKNNLPPDSDSA